MRGSLRKIFFNKRGIVAKNTAKHHPWKKITEASSPRYSKIITHRQQSHPISSPISISQKNPKENEAEENWNKTRVAQKAREVKNLCTILSTKELFHLSVYTNCFPSNISPKWLFLLTSYLYCRSVLSILFLHFTLTKKNNSFHGEWTAGKKTFNILFTRYNSTHKENWSSSVMNYFLNLNLLDFFLQNSLRCFIARFSLCAETWLTVIRGQAICIIN